MIAKGRYVGLIEYDFAVDLDVYGITLDQFRERINGINERIQAELGEIFNNNLSGVKDDFKVTQQYLDVYEVQDDG